MMISVLGTKYCGELQAKTCYLRHPCFRVLTSVKMHRAQLCACQLSARFKVLVTIPAPSAEEILLILYFTGVLLLPNH